MWSNYPLIRMRYRAFTGYPLGTKTPDIISLSFTHYYYAHFTDGTLRLRKRESLARGNM